MTERASSIYLGPTIPRWRPTSWQDVVKAAAGGMLDESHWVELKKDLPPTSPGANTELAKDLASLAVHGGLFVLGVKDNSGQAGPVVGASLGGLRDRIDAVARSRIDPPLFVRAYPEIEDPNNPGHGVLLVEVPSSGQAPHMVDHVYYGRGDRGKITLSDQQVREIMERRLPARADPRAMLQDLADHDPIVRGLRANAHLYLVAHPTTARDDSLLEYFGGKPVQGLEAAAIRARLAKGSEIWPDLPTGAWQRRSAGYAAMSGFRESGQVLEDSLMVLTIREDGGLTLLCGQASTLHHQANTFRGNDSRRPAAVPSVLTGLVYAALALAGELADRQSGYQGQWQLGLRIDGFAGVVAVDYLHPASWRDVHPYDRDTYEQVTESTTVELVEHPEAATERLVGRLLRGLDIDGKYLPLPPPVR